MTDNSNETLLQKIFKEEENYIIVLSIREKIMDKVYEESHKNYIKKQSIKFIVQCAYDALVRYLSFNFYYHPDVPDVRQSIWTPDKPIPPSPKDTWACESVPVKDIEFNDIQDKNEQVEESKEGVEDESSIVDAKTLSYRSIPYIQPKCYTCQGHPCTCLVTADILCKKIDSDSIFEKAHQSKIKVVSKSSKHSVAEKRSVPNLTSTGRLIFSDGDKVVKKSSNKDEPPAEPTATVTPKLEIKEMPKDAVREKSSKKEVHETRYLEDLLKSGNAGTVKLAALRVQSTLQFKPIQQSKKKK